MYCWTCNDHKKNTHNFVKCRRIKLDGQECNVLISPHRKSCYFHRSVLDTPNLIKPVENDNHTDSQDDIVL